MTCESKAGGICEQSGIELSKLVGLVGDDNAAADLYDYREEN